MRPGKLLPVSIQRILAGSTNYISHSNHEKVWDFIYSNTRSGPICLLDAGSGKGEFFEACESTSEEDALFGLDFSMLACSYAGRKIPYVKFVQGNALHLPFGDEAFDFVQCSHLIEHFLPQDAYNLVLELARLVKVNGHLIIRSPTMYGGQQFGGFYDDFTHIRPYPPSSIIYLLGSSRNKLVQATVTPPPSRFRLVTLRWRKRSIYLPGWLVQSKYGRYLQRLLDYSYRWGIHSRTTSGYTLILRKEPETS